ncbi:MAG: hypothetical protein IPP40_18040 [bacterium]|nr:hypothetical protein [bacterium]
MYSKFLLLLAALIAATLWFGCDDKQEVTGPDFVEPPPNFRLQIITIATNDRTLVLARRFSDNCNHDCCGGYDHRPFRGVRLKCTGKSVNWY